MNYSSSCCGSDANPPICLSRRWNYHIWPATFENVAGWDRPLSTSSLVKIKFFVLFKKEGVTKKVTKEWWTGCLRDITTNQANDLMEEVLFFKIRLCTKRRWLAQAHKDLVDSGYKFNKTLNYSLPIYLAARSNDKLELFWTIVCHALLDRIRCKQFWLRQRSVSWAVSLYGNMPTWAAGKCMNTQSAR